MLYERQGYRYGAWVIRIGDRVAVIEAGGDRSFPVLDRLYVPGKPDPRHWDDYLSELAPGAEDRLLSLLRPWNEASQGAPPVVRAEAQVPWTPKIASTPAEGLEGLTALIARTKWKFAWTFARTYPHEYTTKAMCSPEGHARLIDCIERYGVTERFGSTHRKYFYFEERKYWHMGESQSEDQEKWPNVINRTWVDVRRHAANVQHRWTAEEVELQMRLWEIQLEKSTDRLRSDTTP